MGKSSKLKHKHRILLDEGLSGKTSFPKLNNIFDVRHIRDDFKKAGISDAKIYAIAKREDRIIATLNVKHFKPLVKKDGPSVIGISPNLSNKQIDTKLTALLKKLTPGLSRGHHITVNKETDSVKLIKTLA